MIATSFSGPHLLDECAPNYRRLRASLRCGFPGASGTPDSPSATSCLARLRESAQRAGISSRSHPHTLRIASPPISWSPAPTCDHTTALGHTDLRENDLHPSLQAPSCGYGQSTRFLADLSTAPRRQVDAKATAGGGRSDPRSGNRVLRAQPELFTWLHLKILDRHRLVPTSALRDATSMNVPLGNRAIS